MVDDIKGNLEMINAMGEVDFYRVIKCINMKENSKMNYLMVKENNSSKGSINILGIFKKV